MNFFWFRGSNYFLLFNTFCSIFIAALTAYFYIDKHNELTGLRLEIPELAKELKEIQEQNIRFKYEINQFESPIHLLELAQKPEFGYLKYPYQNQIMVIPAPTKQE